MLHSHTRTLLMNSYVCLCLITLHLLDHHMLILTYSCTLSTVTILSCYVVNLMYGNQRTLFSYSHSVGSLYSTSCISTTYIPDAYTLLLCTLYHIAIMYGHDYATLPSHHDSYTLSLLCIPLLSYYYYVLG